jgi:hypothetical protein
MIRVGVIYSNHIQCGILQTLSFIMILIKFLLGMIGIINMVLLH